MKIRRGRWFIVLLILVSLAVMVACTRPARPGDDTATATPDTAVPGVITSTIPAETGGVATTTTDTGAAAETATPIPAVTEATPPQPADQTPETTEGDTGSAATATPETTVESAPATETPATTEGDAAATATPVPTTDTAAATTTAPNTTTTGTPPTTEVNHTIQPGENLYRIGLQYGYSWAVLAQYNNLTNPNYLTVGQVIKIPAAGTTPTPSAPGELLYTVKQGDTLGRIAAAYGISWVQIAEANGIVNPNLIYPGQVLKIPSNTPGPAPQFTHTVKQGETVFLISLHYGVLWTDIAEANNITAPYVIFPGQTLTIPGGS